MPKDEHKSRCCVFDVTIPANRITVGDLRKHFATHCKKYAYQLEQGKSTDYRHYQCRVSLKTKSAVRHLESPRCGREFTTELTNILLNNISMVGPKVARILYQ